MNPSTRERGLAIAAAATFTVGELLTLFGKDLFDIHQWTTNHAIILLTIAGTVASGHLVWEGLKTMRVTGWLAALGFALLFLVGTVLTVYQSVGKQAETSGTKNLSAEQRNGMIASKFAELKIAQMDKENAEKEASLARSGRPDGRGRPTQKVGCGTDCKSWEAAADRHGRTVRGLEEEIARIGPPTPVAPRADTFATVMEVFGANKAQWKAGLQLTEPFFYALFFEVGCIVSLASVGGRRRNRQEDAAQPSTPANTGATVPTVAANDPDPMPPKPGNRKVSTRAAAEADIIELVGRGQPIPSQDTLAARWGCHKGTVSKWLDAFEAKGVIDRQSDGRCKRVVAGKRAAA